MFSSTLFAFLFAPLLILASASNFEAVRRKAPDALAPGDVITCGKGAKLAQHECDVAFLHLGGGIAGKIQILKVNGPSTTGTFGGCTFTATAIDGGNTINASKGRLEHGQEPMIAQCGAVAGSSVKVIGGSSNGGNILLTMDAATPVKAGCSA